MDKPLSRCRVDELLDYATHYRTRNENTPGLKDIDRDHIRVLKELLVYKTMYEPDDGYTLHPDSYEDEDA